MTFYPTLEASIEAARKLTVPEERQTVLQVLIDYIQSKKDAAQPVLLNFICTHNSRRSQFSQIWAQTLADKLGVKIHSYSGGVEVTAFNERAIASIQRTGFKISLDGVSNPKVNVKHSDEGSPVIAFSKLFDDATNPQTGFAAVMTCSHADENCPFIAGAEMRIPVRYQDPKAFDDTEMEGQKYDERSLQIASEMAYVFSKIR